MHWYVLSETTGMATLCASEKDARRESKAYDRLYPRAAPHTATQLVKADLVRALLDGLDTYWITLDEGKHAVEAVSFLTANTKIQRST